MKMLIIIATLTLTDTIMGPVKTRFVVDGQAWKSMIVNTASYLVYLIGLVFLVEYAGPLKYVAAGTAKAIGTYLGVLLSNCFQKDEIWLVQVLVPSEVDGELFMSLLQKNGQKFFATASINHNLSKTYSIDVTCPTREATKLIQEMAPTGSVFINKVSRGIKKKSKQGGYRAV